MTLPAERDAWVTLAVIDRVGGETFATLLEGFGSAPDILRAADSGALRRWARMRRPDDGRPRVLPSVVDRIERWRDLGEPSLREIDALGLWTVTPLDADYPAGLRDLDPPPPLIVGSGERERLATGRTVAVVGTRRPTPHGRALAARISAALVGCGALVVSGLAIGIDGVAHSAALDRAGRTLAVIGGGHRHPGPRAHADLRQAIIDGGGAILSEYQPSVTPSRGTYPRRNRIIAALAQATIVVEAPARSGALITAHHALELGRLLLVTPGRIGDWATAGSLRLLRDTPARLIDSADSMLDDLGFLGSVAGNGTPAHHVPVQGDLRRQSALTMLGGAERAIAERVCRSPAGLDTLVEDTGLEPATVSGAVTLLLMRGWLQPVGPAYLPAGPLLG